MHKCIEMHHKVMRRLIREFNGFEVKTEGDAFMIAFSDPTDAVTWALTAQLELLQCRWPRALYHLQYGAIEESPQGIVRRGLRVRMGLHYGETMDKVDEATSRIGSLHCAFPLISVYTG